jgi:uncharacterized protein (TIGR02246 family)
MTATSTDPIRTIIDQRIAAIHARDLDALLSVLAPNVVLFNAIGPLQRVGIDAVRADLTQWFASYDGEIGYDVRDLETVLGDDVAFCRYLYHVSGTLKRGDAVSMWVRSTICFRRIEGTWLIAHEHTSVPFDAESGQASLGLEP